MQIDIRGNYAISDLVTVFQHLVAQLQDLGIETVEAVSVTFDARRMDGTRVGLRDDAGPASHVILEIADLARPCVGSGKLRVVEAPAPRRSTARAPQQKPRRSYHAERD
ncbi:MAG: hypothetical protein CTY31_14065 [Hyphomicrobium sp.]|nr:MAG: hypothetical protein CTY31_14065 [Hyphomicrobium sp.]